MKNGYEIRGNITAIFIDSPTYGRLETLISTSKLERANEFKGTWYAGYCKPNESFYVIGNNPRVNGRRRSVRLHRWISNVSDDLVCDHHNHNTLDNTDENLRLVTQAENLQNRKGAQINSLSGIRGVSWHKASSKWKAQVKLNSKTFTLGTFNNIEDAEKIVIEFRKNNMPFSMEGTGTC